MPPHVVHFLSAVVLAFVLPFLGFGASYFSSTSMFGSNSTILVLYQHLHLLIQSPILAQAAQLPSLSP